MAKSFLGPLYVCLGGLALEFIKTYAVLQYVLIRRCSKVFFQQLSRIILHCNLLSLWTQVVAGDRQSGQSSLTSDRVMNRQAAARRKRKPRSCDSHMRFHMLWWVISPSLPSSSLPPSRHMKRMSLSHQLALFLLLQPCRLVSFLSFPPFTSFTISVSVMLPPLPVIHILSLPVWN